MQTEMCTATSTPSLPVETQPGGCPLPESGIDSTNILLPRPPAAPGGRSYRRRDSILLMQTAAQAEQLASADATTTKTLDNIEALLASLKSSSLGSAPVEPATPKPPDMPASAPSPKVMVKSRFMDVHTNAAAEISGAAPKVRKILRRSSCTALPYHTSSGATASDGMEPGSPVEEGCLLRDPLDSPLQSSRGGPSRPVGSLAAVRHSRSSLTSGGGSTAGPAALSAELSGNSLTSGGGKALSPIKPFPQQQLRQGMAGGIARPPPRRNVSCSLLLSSAAIPMSRASSLMASPRVSSGSLQMLGAINNDDDESDDDDGMRLTSEASGTSVSSTAAAARRGSVFLPGSAGVAAADPGRSSLPSGLSGAQANMKQPSVSFFANALAIRRASSTAGPGELPQLSLSAGGQLLPSIGISNCVTQPSTPR